MSALETWRFEQRVQPDDLFSTAKSTAVEIWQAEALTAVEAAARRRRRELTVMDADWSPTIDNRARGTVMRLAAKRGIVRRLGYVNGDRGRHGRRLVLWASLVCDARTVR